MVHAVGEVALVVVGICFAACTIAANAVARQPVAGSIYGEGAGPVAGAAGGASF